MTARPCARARRSGATERERRETYLLPGDAAEQGLRGAAVLLGARPGRVVDLGTGSGVLGQRARTVFPGAERVGVEIRREEEAASRHYDRWILGDLRRVRVPAADLVVSNPPFSLAVETVLVALDTMVRPGGLLLIFARKTWGESSAAATLLESTPPLEQWLVHRRLALAEDEDGEASGSDNCCHVWWAWRAGRRRTRRRWTTRLLPALPSAGCAWTIRPGEEPDQPEPLDPAFWPRLDEDEPR